VCERVLSIETEKKRKEKAVVCVHGKRERGGREWGRGLQTKR